MMVRTIIHSLLFLAAFAVVWGFVRETAMKLDFRKCKMPVDSEIVLAVLPNNVGASG